MENANYTESENNLKLFRFSLKCPKWNASGRISQQI